MEGQSCRRSLVLSVSLLQIGRIYLLAKLPGTQLWDPSLSVVVQCSDWHVFSCKDGLTPSGSSYVGISCIPSNGVKDRQRDFL